MACLNGAKCVRNVLLFVFNFYDLHLIWLKMVRALDDAM